MQVGAIHFMKAGETMAKTQKDIKKLLSINCRAYDYWCLMADMCADMFAYPDLWERTRVPDDDLTGIEIATLIQYAMVSGVSGVAYHPELDRWVCGRLSWADVQNDNGIARRCVLNGVSWAHEYDIKDVAFYRNYYTQNAENQLKWFAMQFADTDTAQKALIRHTRYTPMPVASNEAEQREYQNAMERNINGEDITVLLRPQSSPLLGNGQRQTEDDKILNLSDPEMIGKMHFLSEYHAELKKRFGAMYGMCFKSSSKSAQETVDEVHGMDNFSLIIPFLKLKSLKDFADQCKRKFGWAGSETVEFTELWQREDEKAEKEGGTIDDSETEGSGAELAADDDSADDNADGGE
jgi:hypothetical protein